MTRLVSVQGYRQAVRHSTLTAAVAGSNPASPVAGLPLAFGLSAILQEMHVGGFFILGH